MKRGAVLDKVALAFQDLEDVGIRTGLNQACCQTCGAYELREGVKTADDPERYFGIAFFHQQDRDSFSEDGYLYIAFGDMRDGDMARAVGQVVEASLRRHGLDVEWDEDSNHRIAVVAELSQ